MIICSNCKKPILELGEYNSGEECECSKYLGTIKKLKSMMKDDKSTGLKEFEKWFAKGYNHAINEIIDTLNKFQ